MNEESNKKPIFVTSNEINKIKDIKL